MGKVKPSDTDMGKVESPTTTPESIKDNNELTEEEIDPKQLQTTESMLKWSQAVKETRGDFPMVRVTPQFLQMCGGANMIIPIPPGNKAEEAVRLDGSAFMSQDSPSSSATTTSSFRLSSAELAKRYPGATERRRMAPAEATLKYHTFDTERRKMANLVKLGQKLAPFNPLPPLDPEKIMRCEGLPGIKDEEVQVEIKDWGENGSELMYQAILFKNQAEVGHLRDKRELLSDSKFYMLKPVVKDLAL